MGKVVWFSTLLILVFICQGTAQQCEDGRFVAAKFCYRGMHYDETKRHKTLEIMRDNTLNGDILCDTVNNGGGWIVIQRRTKGDVDFYRNWDEYKRGFGNPPGDFWLGNDALYELTNKDEYELRIDFDNRTHDLYALYSSFKIESKANNYTLRLGSHSGTLGEDNTDEGFSYSNGMQFSTYDRDNDAWESNCAKDHGAGWYRRCYGFNPNGAWGKLWWDEGVLDYYASSLQIKIRRI